MLLLVYLLEGFYSYKMYMFRSRKSAAALS